MEKEKKTTIGDIDVAMAVIAHQAVDCFRGIEQPKTIQPNKLVSCTGGTFFGIRGEKWPTTQSGEPLIPWLQVVCTDMKNVYGAFYNRKAVCFYINHDLETYEATSAVDDTDFVVREYSLNDDLFPLVRPPQLKGYPFHQVDWKRDKDYPAISSYCELFDDNVYASLCKMKQFKFENRSGIKIGGWPTPIQGRQEYPGSCDLQIDMTENYTYGDSGIGYLTRTGNHWYVNFDCC